MKLFVKSTVILLAIVVIFGAAMFGLNFHTSPIIEANNAGAELAPLLAVMPEGAQFDGNALIYSAENPAAYTLQNVGANVLTIYKEANGLGFAVRCQATSQYSKEPMELTIGIDAEGKICGLQLDKYTDSIDFRSKDANYLSSYIGKDSALADIGTVSGCTYSTISFKGAVSEGLSALISNNLIAEGVKSDSQILEELIPTVAPGFTKLSELTASGNIQKAMKAENDAGFAYIMTEGEATYLVLVNAMGVCAVYDVEGGVVTDAHEALVSEAKAHASANQKEFATNADKKFGRLFEGATEITPITLDSFSSIVYAVSFKLDDATYYGFYSRSIGFEQMDVYVVIDENGAIAKLDAATLFFETEYFPVDDNVNEKEYEGSFNGLTGESFNGENAMIAGATMTSEAVKQSAIDAFVAFESINEGGAN